MQGATHDGLVSRRRTDAPFRSGDAAYPGGSRSARGCGPEAELGFLGTNYPEGAGGRLARVADDSGRSEEHTSELQSLMRISYAVFSLTKKNNTAYQFRNKATKQPTAISRDIIR